MNNIVDINDVLKTNPISIDVTVTGLRWFMLRARLGVLIMRLGAFVAGVKANTSIAVKN